MAFIGKDSVTVTSLDSAESMSVVTDLTVDTNTLKVDSTANRVGILNATPDVTLDVGLATDAIHIPVGTTAQRPGTPSSGYFRFNTSLNQFEGYTNIWGAIGGGGTNTFTHDSFTGDNITTDFILSQSTESENNLFVFIDGVFQTQDAYSIATAAGQTTLTLSAPPATGRKIIVYTVAAGVSGNNLNQNRFDALTSDVVDGLNTTFTLSIPPVNKNNTQVFFDGVYQHKENYSVSGTTLTFTDAPPLGVVIEVMIFTQTEVNVPVDDSITSVKLSGDLTTPGNLTVTGYLAGPATFIIDPAAIGDNTGTVQVKGNLQVDGTQTIINSTTLQVDDLNITLASGAVDALSADGAGITIDGASATLTYVNAGDNWNFNKNLDVTGTVTADGLTVDGDVTLQNTGDSFRTQTFDSNRSASVLTLARNDYQWNGTSVARLQITSGSDATNKDNGYFTFFTSEDGTLDTRMVIAENGDISFYEDTGTTAKLFWDASAESLGIGTTSASSYNSNWNDLVIDGGTSSGITIVSGTTGDGTIGFADGTTGDQQYRGYVQYRHSTDLLKFGTSGTDQIVIDSSGNLLVSNTVPVIFSSSSITGHNIAASGTAQHNASQETVMYLNRLSTDGDIVDFRKDGATVGSIGTVVAGAADQLYINSDDVGLRFRGSDDSIVPCTSVGTFRNGFIDLGKDTGRFKDLYLSGGVKFGTAGATSGTGTEGTDGNNLDDYEEGTWVATAVNGCTGLSSSTTNNRYTKIGNVVHVIGEISSFTGTTSGNLEIGGLPFAVGNGMESSFSVLHTNINLDSGYTQVVGYAFPNASKFRIYEVGDNVAYNVIRGDQISSGSFIFQMTYHTA